MLALCMWFLWLIAQTFITEAAIRARPPVYVPCGAPLYVRP
jgi:hypothetical protein